MKTLKFLSMLVAVTMLGFSCSSSDKDDPGTGPGPGETGMLTLSIAPSAIQSDGEDAAEFKVLYDGQPVTEGVEIYDAATDKLLNLPSLRFTTTTPGIHSFWAAYKTAHSAVATLEALDLSIPARPADPKPASTDFERRVLLTQFTGTNCGWCPFMVTLLRSALAEQQFASSVVLAAAHLYNSSDPAYLSSANLDQAMGVTGFPTVVVDMHTSYVDYRNLSGLEKVLSSALARTNAKAGISVNSALDGNKLVVRATVKAAETAELRVGAWLLEDGINGKQVNNGATGDFNTHDNCIRLADSRVSSVNYTGLSLGTINKGETGDHVFVMTLDETWVKENCHLVVFVSAAERKTFYVNNVVKAPLGAEVAFDYE